MGLPVLFHSIHVSVYVCIEPSLFRLIEHLG